MSYLAWENLNAHLLQQAVCKMRREENIWITFPCSNIPFLKTTFNTELGLYS